MTVDAQIVDAQPVSLAKQEPQQTALSMQALPPAVLLSIAVQQGADTQKLKELMDLQDRHEAKLARLAYSNAIVQFQALCPVVIRTGNNTRFGNQYPQWSTAHPQIKSALDTAQLGVTHSLLQDEKGKITVIGQVRHGPSGHIEEIRLSAQPDHLASKEGKAVRNEVQAIKSTITYLQWETAACLLGLQSRDRLKDEKIDPKVQAAIDPGDDDGNTSGLPKSNGQNEAEKVAQAEFVRICRRKTGDENLPKAIMQQIVAKVQGLCGSKSAVACLDYIDKDSVVLSKDGSVAVVTDQDNTGDPFADQTPAAPTGSPPASSGGPAPEPPLSLMAFECDECSAKYKVMPAGGKCLTKVCFGHVGKSKERSSS